MNQANSEQLNAPTNLDVDLKENELSDDDLDAVSGGYPGNIFQDEYEPAQPPGNAPPQKPSPENPTRWVHDGTSRRV